MPMMGCNDPDYDPYAGWGQTWDEAGYPKPWSDAEVADLIAAPYNYEAHKAKYPWRSAEAFSVKRKRLGITRAVAGGAPPEYTADDVTWEDFLGPIEAMQRLKDKVLPSTDEGITFRFDRDTPIAFISDWHMGSWGTDYRLIKENTDRLRRLHERDGLQIAVLGDMLQMAIKLRGILEISDNLLPPRMQLRMLELWLEQMAPMMVWSTWDNHAVTRQEDATGHSAYADLFRDNCVYYSGIGHSVLEVGRNIYCVATSHYFPGRSSVNPLYSQMNYIRRESPHQDAVVAGDSHNPAILHYVDGGKERVVANCGSLQTKSGYGQRYFSLHTFTAMPIIVFRADQRGMAHFFSIDEYEWMKGAA